METLDQFWELVQLGEFLSSLVPPILHPRQSVPFQSPTYGTVLFPLGIHEDNHSGESLENTAGG